MISPQCLWTPVSLIQPLDSQTPFFPHTAGSPPPPPTKAAAMNWRLTWVLGRERQPKVRITLEHPLNGRVRDSYELWMYYKVTPWRVQVRTLEEKPQNRGLQSWFTKEHVKGILPSRM